MWLAIFIGTFAIFISTVFAERGTWSANGSYEYYVSEPRVGKSYHTSRTVCESYGGRLALVKAEETQLFIQSLVPANSGKPYGFYIGLQDIDGDGIYIWDDGVELDYAHWRVGEPNDFYSERCVLTGDHNVYLSDLPWVNTHCNRPASGKKGYVCERLIGWNWSSWMSWDQCACLGLKQRNRTCVDTGREGPHSCNGTETESENCSSTSFYDVTSSQMTTVPTPKAKHCENDTSCGQHGLCSNTGFYCTCKIGYTGDGYNCTDIDECAENNRCHSDSECTNTDGSYACTCKPGYTGDGSSCTNINECDTVYCDTCSDRSPGFYCGCTEGFIGFYTVQSYTHDKYTLKLYDYDTGDCSPLPYTNCSYSSYRCLCTIDLFSNDGFCMEIDSCISSKHTCHDNATCIDGSNGNYSCQCKDGFVGDGRDCSDVDECGISPPPCNNCINTIGSYSCGCNQGYGGDLCGDIDECAEGTHDCHPQAVCTNTPGGYICTCNEDYNLSSDNGAWCSGCPADSWSRWVDSDLGFFSAGNLGRANGLGDFEMNKKIRSRFPDLNICEKPTNIEARIMNGKPYREGGEKVHISIDGFYCLNSEQDDGKCHNYYVRFCCPETESHGTTVAPKQMEESSVSAVYANRLLPFLNTTSSEIASKHECSASHISIQWTKSDFLSGYFYKLQIQDMLTNDIKKTSVQVVMKNNATIQITATSTDHCSTVSKLSVLNTDNTVVHVVAVRLNERMKIIAKVFHQFGEKTQELTFIDFV